MTPSAAPGLGQRAAELARRVGGAYGQVTAVTRFPTGMCHYVFDVETTGGAVVVRVADPVNRHLLQGALAWSSVLRPLGVPLPAVLAHDVAVTTPLPYVVLERLAGEDLGLVHATMTPQERHDLAASVVAVQRSVHGLGPGSGFGACAGPGARPPLASWPEVVLANLHRSGERLRSGPPPVRRLHGQVERAVGRHRPYLDAVRPLPFLEDTTTKNVLVDAGRLTGVVDVDTVCFGDPLWTPALTRVALAASDLPADYVDAWLHELAPSAPARAAFDLYCAVFCLDLLSEAGASFNRDEPVVLDHARTGRLVDLATRLVRPGAPGHGAPGRLSPPPAGPP